MKTLLRKILPLTIAAALLLSLGACSLPFVGDNDDSPWWRFWGTTTTDANDGGPGNGAARPAELDNHIPFDGVNFDDYIELGDYIGVTIDEEEILLDFVRGLFAQVGHNVIAIEPDESRTVVEEGDNIMFDFSGYVEGLGRFEGGTAEGHVMANVGAGTFIPGFEEQMIGQTVGVEFDVTVTFPENYGVPDLDGQTAVFTCTVHAIGDVIPGIPSDEEVAMLTQGEFETLEAFLRDLREDEAATKEQMQTAAFDAAFENATILGLPETEIQHFIDELFWQLEDISEQVGMSPEEILQQEGFASINEYQEVEIEPWVARELFAFAVAAQEGIEITEEALDEFLAEMREMHPDVTADWDDDELIAELGGHGRLERHLLMMAVSAFIYDNAVAEGD